ncbi:RNA polymerase sigma-70 factor (ECF subfamily) [Catenulispora sp. GAS73]|uniref:RNA polymerase sigma factor SigE n=1 Tax=Catenulispora sp. GAS73 TaxID=3156269 RepID=UPI00351652E4
MVMSAVLEIGGGDVVADANSARNPGAVPVNTIGPRIDLGELRRRRAARKAALEKNRRSEAIPDTTTPAEAVASVGETQPLDAAAVGWEPPSWDDIVRTHSQRVYRLAYRLTGNQHDAEDLTQEVFIRVFRSLSSYQPGTFEGWLHRITTNLFLDMVRRRARIRFDSLGEDADDRLPGREPSPERIFVDSHMDADIEAALAALAPEFRAAVVLCDIEGLSYEEIAATLDVKLGTVRSRIHRGRSQLRAALEHRAPGGAASAAGGKEGRR